MKRNFLAKLVGGICILGATYFLGYHSGSKTVTVDSNINQYLTKIEQSLDNDISLTGDIKILKNIKGKVLLCIDDKIKIDIMEGVNNVYDFNVDMVEIRTNDPMPRLLRLYQNIDFYKPYDEVVRKMSLEDQVIWNTIYNKLVDKDSETSFTIG